jgi:hypothetical protein
MMGWPATPFGLGVVQPPQHISLFLRNKIKYVMGVFKKKKKSQSGRIVTIWKFRKLSVTFKTLEVKMQMNR